MKKTVLRKYAQLIAASGVNVQPGQEVFIAADLDQPEFVKLLVEECYKRKAKKVVDVGDRFLGYDVLPARNGFLNLLRAGIRQGEQPDRLNLGVVEYDLFVGYYFRPGREPLGQFP